MMTKTSCLAWVWPLGLAAVSTVLATGCVSPVDAAEDLPSIRVVYTDLDLTRITDAKVLYSRLKRAARTVCGMDYIQAEEELHGHRTECYRTTLERAVAKVDSPILTAMHGNTRHAGPNRTLVSQGERP